MFRGLCNNFRVFPIDGVFVRRRLTNNRRAVARSPTHRDVLTSGNAGVTLNVSPMKNPPGEK